MTRNALPVLVLSLAIGIGIIAAGPEHADFSGKWELNVGKSNFGKMAPPTRMTLDAKRNGDMLHSVQTFYDQTGGPNATEGDWYLDGKERTLGTDGKMTSMSRWDGNSILSVRKSKDDAYNETIRLTMSADGRSATEEIDTRDPNGHNKSTLFWERR